VTAAEKVRIICERC